MSTITESIRRLTAKFGRVPCLDATTDLKVKASSHRKLRRKLDRVDGLLEHIPLHKECGVFRVLVALPAVLFQRLRCVRRCRGHHVLGILRSMTHACLWFVLCCVSLVPRRHPCTQLRSIQ